MSEEPLHLGGVEDDRDEAEAALAAGTREHVEAEERRISAAQDESSARELLALRSGVTWARSREWAASTPK